MDRSPTDRTLVPRFARLTALNILASVTVPLAGLVDAAMLGHLDDLRFLGGVALASVLFDFVYWSFAFLRMGTTGTTAQAVGEAGAVAAREVDLALYRPLVLAVGLAALLLALQRPFADLGFALLGGTPAVEAAGRDYFFARIWAAPATLANFAFLGWFLGREESGRALALTLTANLVNVAVNYVLILRLGWAAAGAGWGTAAGQYAMLAVALGLFARTRRRAEPLPGARRLAAEVFDRREMGGLLALNRDLLIRTLCLVGTFALFTNLSAAFGTVVLAANTLLLRVFLLASHAVDGAAYATEALAGIFRGGRNRAALARLVRLALWSGVVLSVPFALLVVAAPGWVFGLLTSHTEAVRVAAAYAPWLALVMATGAAAFIFDGLFLGLTAGRALRNTMLLSFFVVYLPLALSAARWELPWLLWLGLVLFMVARTATLGWATPRLLAEARA